MSKGYDVVGFGISRQQINVAAGTALAFLVKVALAAAVSIAYTQALWTTIRQKEAKLRTLDVITTALDNILALFKIKVWWKYPVLLLLALSVW